MRIVIQGISLSTYNYMKDIHTLIKAGSINNVDGLIDIELDTDKLFSFDFFTDKLVIRYKTACGNIGHVMLDKNKFIKTIIF